ncbi:MAG TPA: hypothetical protein VN493_04545 [Thermoanaerobaculia bacterium]|nr:hypothetical protein [Thermoanaerobaculia bacterium]
MLLTEAERLAPSLGMLRHGVEWQHLGVERRKQPADLQHLVAEKGLLSPRKLQNHLEEIVMAPPVSTEKLLAQLEKQLEHHRERETFHSEQESAHREQREQHAREGARIAQTVDSLRSSLTTALGLVAPSASVSDEDMDTGHVRILTRLVNRVIEGMAGDERFGAAALTDEVNRRFANLLRRPVSARHVSLVLRRQARHGRIHQVRRGRPHYEALYVRERP